MKNFSVERLSFVSINELPNSWSNKDFKELLNAMNYPNPDDIKDNELKEMCLMSFTDMDPAEASKVVLEYLLKDKLNEKQIENLAHQMLTEKLWEENPELSMHEDFFKATQLLYTAYNGKFPKAEAVKFQIKLTADDGESLLIFDHSPEAPLLRLIAMGLSDHTLIRRLFSDKLKGTNFEEAKNIIWQLSTIQEERNIIIYEVISSAYWLNDFKFVDPYSANTHEDILVEEES